MTDQELIQLLETKLPQELSFEEIELIRSRLSASVELRAALSGHITLERQLVESLGPVQISTEQIVAKAAAHRSLTHPIFSLFSWGVCLLLGAFLVSLLVLSRVSPSVDEIARRQAIEAAAPDQGIAQSSSLGSEVVVDDGSATKSAQGKGEVPSRADNAGADKDWKQTVTKDKNSKDAVAVQSPPAAINHSATVVDAPAGPPKPWDDAANLGGPERPWQELGFVHATAVEDPTRRSDLLKWLTPQGAGKIEERDFFGARVGHIEGYLKLLAPVKAGTALVMGVSDTDNFRVHLINGNQGVSFYAYPEHRKFAWAAYAVERKHGQLTPTTLLDTDNGFNWQVHRQASTTYVLHFGEKNVSLIRGDVVLLQVPVDSPPQEVLFEGRTLIQHLALVHSTQPVRFSETRPTIAAIDRPADASWIGELPPGATLATSADGAMELSTQSTSGLAWGMFPLPQTGLQEIIAEIGDPQPGSRIVLGSAKGKPIYALGFFREPRTGGLSVSFVSPGDGRAEWDFNFADDISPLVGPQRLIKIVHGIGILRCWTSSNGKTWTEMASPMPRGDERFAMIGLSCVQGNEKRGISLRRVEFRRLGLAAELAPADLLRTAVLPGPRMNYQSWQELVEKSRPLDADPLVWRTACALRAVESGASRELNAKLQSLLADDIVARPATLRWRLGQLSELSLVADTWDDRGAAERLANRFIELGKREYRNGNQRAFTAVCDALLRAPVRSRHALRTSVEELARAELYELIYAGKWAEVREIGTRLAVLNPSQSHGPRNRSLAAWAVNLAEQSLGEIEGTYTTRLSSDDRHPLVIEPNREAYNVLAEFNAALVSGSYENACQIISSADAATMSGLLPNASDPLKFSSLLAIAKAAARHHEGFLTVMCEKFGPVADLQFLQAKAANDTAALRAITLRFVGTTAATKAHLWLGDSALSAGNITAAMGHYYQAHRSATEDLSDQVEARLRLGAAMAGQERGQPVTERVAFGETELSVEEFESMLVASRRGRATKIYGSSDAPTGDVVTSLQPKRFDATGRSRLDGEVGENAHEIPGPVKDQGIDWVAKQLSAVKHDDSLLVSNRFQVSSYDIKSGARRWQTSLGGEHGRTHEWSQVPMRPVPVGATIFVRRLLRDRPELAALSTSDGRVEWRSEAGLMIVSDPVFVLGQLFALTGRPRDGGFQLSLSVFDPQSGAVLSQSPLFGLGPSWLQHRTAQLAATDDALVAVLGGSVAVCEFTGQQRWIRRQPWIPMQVDQAAHGQHHQRPVVSNNRIYAMQPGVRSVECTDLQTGDLLWRKVLPAGKRIIGVAGYVICQTSDELVALHPETGDVLWRRDEDGLLEASLCGDEMLLCARRQPQKDDPKYVLPELVWIKTSTGQEDGNCPLPSLRQERLAFGPIVAADDRAWVFAGRLDDATRDLVELAPVGELAALTLNLRRLSERAAAVRLSIGQN